MPIEAAPAPPGQPTVTPAPYRELAFDADTNVDTALDAPEPVHATPTPVDAAKERWRDRAPREARFVEQQLERSSRTPTTYPPPEPTPRPGVASIFVGLPRDPGETTSEIPHLPPAASPEATSLVGSQAEQTGGTGGLPIEDPIGILTGEVARLRAVVASMDARVKTYADEASKWRNADLSEAAAALDGASTKAEIAKMVASKALERREKWEAWFRQELPKLFAVLTAGSGTFAVMFLGVLLVVLKRTGVLPDEVLTVISAIIEILRVLW